jgi:hypothetical protein
VLIWVTPLPQNGLKHIRAVQSDSHFFIAPKMNVGQSNRWKETLDRWFCATAVLVLALTAVTKGIGAAGEARILAQPDPLLGM